MSEEEVTDLGHIETTPEPPTNDLALVSLLTGVGGWVVLLLGLCSLSSPFGVFCGGISLLSWLVALPTGYLAQREIAEHGESGRRMARTGVAAGVLGMLAVMLILLLVILGLLGIISVGIFGT